MKETKEKKTEERKKRIIVKLIEQERTEVEHHSTGVKSWAMKLLYKGMMKGEDPKYLPIVVNHLVDGDDDNILKQVKEKAREAFKKHYYSL